MPAGFQESALVIGKVLGHYRILEQIGAGGMGVVYRAHDERLGRDVALKAFPPTILPDEAARRRFRREARTLSRFTHPNVATIFDFDTQDGIDFLITELIAGETLERKLQSGALGEPQVVALGVQIADALAAAHEKGVIHCDLKPSNVMLAAEERVKILDFGLARFVGPATSDLTTSLEVAGTVAGTLPYMAPEQVTGEALDARVDVWAAGALLYEAATGRRPFQQQTTMALAAEIVHGSPVAPRKLRSAVSRQLEAIILKCLSKAPGDRYQSMQALHADLSRSGSGPVASATVSTRRPQGRRIRSLVVLPLVNLANDPDQDYFADGMTEAVISNLAKLGALKVISRTSAMRYKGTRHSLTDIARELGVDAVIEGSILRVGSRVRVTVQLIHGASDTHLWAESYERDLDDVLRLQREVARAIAVEVKGTLSSQEEGRLGRGRRVKPSAYEACLKGFYHARRLAKDAVDQAMAQFRLALAEDPSYAPAYAGLAYTYITGAGDWYMPNREALVLAKQMATKALELDPALAEAHTFLAITRFMHDHDWAEAEQDFRRALDANPGSPDAHRWFGIFCGALGRFDPGVEAIRRSLSLDPFSVEGHVLLGLHLYFWRRYEDAIPHLRRALELDSTYFWGEMILGLAHEQREEYPEAIAALDRARRLATAAGGLPPELPAKLAAAHVRAGHPKEAAMVFDELADMKHHRYVPPYDIAVFHAARRDTEQTLEWLSKAYADRNWWMAWIKVDPKFDFVRDEPRFQSLLQRMNLAQ